MLCVPGGYPACYAPTRVLTGPHHPTFWPLDLPAITTLLCVHFQLRAATNAAG